MSEKLNQVRTVHEIIHCVDDSYLEEISSVTMMARNLLLYI